MNETHVALSAAVQGITAEVHTETRQVPRWPGNRLLGWVKRDESTLVIDRFHLTGVSLTGLPVGVLPRRNFVLVKDPKVPQP